MSFPVGSSPLVATVRRGIDWLPKGRSSLALARRRHRWINLTLFAHIPAIFLYGLTTDISRAHLFVEVGGLAAMASLASLPVLSHRTRAVVTTIGLLGCSITIVHLSGGMIEAHFHYFVVIAIVALYEDWAPFGVAISIVILQHGVIGSVDPTALFNHPAALAHPWRWSMLHGAFVAAESLVCLVGWRLSENSSLRDDLTGLPNRALFHDRLAHAMDLRSIDGHDIAVLLLDIDDFKEVNDEVGHQGGDQVLVEVAGRIMGAVRAGDTVARLDGDEFVVLLEQSVVPGVAEQLAERIASALRMPSRVDGVTLNISSGIAYASNAPHAVDLVRNADVALYEAKRHGKSRNMTFDRGMHRRILEEQALLADLRAAIEQDRLDVAYQPIVDLLTGEISGFEALARWRHPRRGWISPEVFVSLAEDAGVITELGDLVLARACDALSSWRASASVRAWTMSVNVSVRQLLDDGFVDRATQIVIGAGLSPSDLILEITESAMFEDAAMTARLSALKDAGFGLAVDDFGTGYSTIRRLGLLRFDHIKIDRSFVEGIAGSVEESVLPRAMLRLARGMGIPCVAEGVEHVSQVQRLRREGCRYAQGFLFSRPLGAAEMKEFVLSWSPTEIRPDTTILVVEDDETIRALIARRLGTDNLSSVAVGSGTEALRVLSSRPVDLVILDLGLPDMDGLDVLDAIRSDSMIADTPVIVLTGRAAEPGLRAQLLERGANVCWAKPFHQQELVAQARTLLSHAARAS